MALIRPNTTIIMELDERLYSRETELEIKRCYSHIGVPVIRKRAVEAAPTAEAGKPDAAQGADAQTAGETGASTTPRQDDVQDPQPPYYNVVRILVSLGTSKYLYSADEGADELWADAIEPAIANALHNIGANMKSFNKRQRKINLPEIIFNRLSVELAGGSFIVALHPDALSFLDRDLRDQINLARTLLNDGTFEGVVRVDVPAEQAYLEQHAAAKQIWDEQHPAPAPEDGDAAADDTAAANTDPASQITTDEEGHTILPAATSDDEYAERARKIAQQALEDQKRGTERFFDEEWLAMDAQRKSYENTAVAPTESDELPPAYHLPEIPEPELFDFEVDYTLWAVTDAQGATRLFNSKTLAFTDEA